MKRFAQVFLLSTIAFCFVSLAFPQVASAQRSFDVEGYLKRIDTNGNGSLEPGEMRGRTRDFIAKMGFNVEKPVSIRKIVSKANKDRAKREADERAKNAPPLKVPGFAPDSASSGKKSGVLGFSNDPNSSVSSSSSSSKETYSDSVNRRVDDVLGRYDKNKNGTLEANEIKEARWGSPSPLTHDKNKDGKLTRNELAQRYIDREKYYNRERNERGGSDDRKSRSRFQSSNSSRSSSSGSGGFASSNSSRGGSSRSSSGGSSSSGSSKTDTKKYESYVDGLMDRYDKNKDGKFDKDEIKEMRRPPMTADVNKDGEITRKELLDMLTGNKPSSDSKSKASSGSSSGSSRSKSRGGFGSSRGSSRRGSSSFSSMDKNNDGQIQMYEFATKWTKELSEEFMEKDKNDDGILSQEEFSSR